MSGEHITVKLLLYILGWSVLDLEMVACMEICIRVRIFLEVHTDTAVFSTTS